MTDNNCRYLTEVEIGDALRIQLQDAKLDLAAARARIAELESKTLLVDAKQRDVEYLLKVERDLQRRIDRQCDDLDKSRARIAELEDWQRRAVGTGLLDEHNGCQCRTCRDVTQLLSEVKS